MASLIFNIMVVNMALISLILLISPTAKSFSRPLSASEAKSVGLGFPQVTNITFYFHDIVSGPNPTAVRIAAPKAKYPMFFGGLIMIDDPLTYGPDMSSGIMGRAQGMYGSADLEVSGLVMVLNFVFTEGEHKGSTLSLLGRNAVMDKVREMPILGGTGKFRFATGFAQASTYHLDFTTGDAVVEYHVTVFHFGQA
ncbi:disease resistance-responsive (dirigent-likeprotein) family protein [Striga asiatica]|uniref:Dirigent protein n=1 Tax=Striga asiatica TaxID=4170 RepID=A0A5A7Q659_STRAF|nr:disease resistance-responsive (dirigent-likeprotein) family protein [Striga asiatica]